MGTMLRILLVAVVGFVIANYVACLGPLENAVMIYDEEDWNSTDYVSENLDDLQLEDEVRKKRIVDDTNDLNNVPIVYRIDNRHEDKRGSDGFYGIRNENNGVKEKVPATLTPMEAQPDPGAHRIHCRLFPCGKMGEAIERAWQEMKGQMKAYGDAPTSIIERKKRLILSIPKAGLTFVRTLMNRDQPDTQS